MDAQTSYLDQESGNFSVKGHIANLLGFAEIVEFKSVVLTDFEAQAKDWSAPLLQ